MSPPRPLSGPRRTPDLQRQRDSAIWNRAGGAPLLLRHLGLIPDSCHPHPHLDSKPRPLPLTTTCLVQFPPQLTSFRTGYRTARYSGSISGPFSHVLKFSSEMGPHWACTAMLGTEPVTSRMQGESATKGPPPSPRSQWRQNAPVPRSTSVKFLVISPGPR